MEPNVFIDSNELYPVHTVEKPKRGEWAEVYIPPDMLAKISRVMKEFKAIQKYLDDKIKEANGG